jgi:hypothetical protein
LTYRYVETPRFGAASRPEGRNNGREIYQVFSQWELLDGTSETPAVEKRMDGAEGQS